MVLLECGEDKTKYFVYLNIFSTATNSIPRLDHCFRNDTRNKLSNWTSGKTRFELDLLLFLRYNLILFLLVSFKKKYNCLHVINKPFGSQPSFSTFNAFTTVD